MRHQYTYLGTSENILLDHPCPSTGGELGHFAAQKQENHPFCVAKLSNSPPVEGCPKGGVVEESIIRGSHLYRSLCGIGAALICFLLLFCFQFPPAGAQTQSLVDTSRDHEFEPRIQTFFRTLQGGHSQLAFDGLLHQSPLNLGDPQAVADSRSRVDEMRTQFGEILHWERFESKQIGEDVVLVRYVLKYDHYPVVWTFTLYRKPTVTPSISNPNPWLLVELHFDTNLRNL